MQIFMLIAFFGVAIVCFFAMKKIDIFVEKNINNVHNTNRTNLIHLGFDAPYLAEDFIAKVNEADHNQHPMQTVIYTGTEKELVDMLLIGKLDYIVLTHKVTDSDLNQGECIEITLRPQSLYTHVGDLHINPSVPDEVKTQVFWLPRWIGKDKEFYSALLREKSSC